MSNSKSGRKFDDKENAKYIDTLDKVSRCRYLSKLTAVRNVDPYEIDRWNDDTSLLPPIEKDDISEYLVHRTSFYTREKFKAEKSLGAHNQLTSGWVKKIYVCKPPECDNIIITSQVCHSQALSEKPLKPWVIAAPDGTVVTAHCTCMAGIGETCTHVAALLFAVDATVRLRDSRTPTQIPAAWMVPSARQAMYEETGKIDFSSSAAKRRRLEESLSGTACGMKGRRRPTAVTPPSHEEGQALLESIQRSRTGVLPVALSIRPVFGEDYVVEDKSLPMFLDDLYNEGLAGHSFSHVLQRCDSIFSELRVTRQQAENAEVATRQQYKSKTWMRLRVGRITASKAHQACHTNPAQPSLSLIHQICSSAGARKETAAMRWGISHEQVAKELYFKAVYSTHDDFFVEQCGLFFNPKFPFLAASPDGIRHCKCHGKGCLEVKCPASKAQLTIRQSCSDASFCLQEHADGTIALKRTHPYYLQVQMQMIMTETDFCDFVVWTEKDLFIECIPADVSVWQEALPKMEHLFKNAILPELVGHCFSRPRPLPLSPQKLNTSHNVTDAELYCYCKRTEEEDDMVACDNSNCSIEWFHFFCVGIHSKPKGRWYCPDCRQLPEFRRTGKVQPKKP